MEEDKKEKSKNLDLLDKIIEKQLRRFNADIVKHLPKELTPTLLLLKGHLLIEYYIGLLLILNDENEKILELTFHEKVSKCRDKELLGVKHIESLLKLNKVRNRMSHELEYTISESDVDNVAIIFGKEYVIKKLDTEKGKENTKELLMWVLKKNLGFILAKTVMKLHQEKKALKKSS